MQIHHRHIPQHEQESPPKQQQQQQTQFTTHRSSSNIINSPQRKRHSGTPLLTSSSSGVSSPGGRIMGGKYNSGATTSSSSSSSSFPFSLLPKLPSLKMDEDVISGGGDIGDNNNKNVRMKVGGGSAKTTATTVVEPFEVMPSSPWMRKPLWTLKQEEEEEEDEDHHDHHPSNTLKRHLTLFDLVSVGVGGTIGSGIFVLCGLIATEYAGPATFLSWGMAGIAATLSGCCFAELASCIPTSGSSYAYAYVSMGELPAFLSAACLTLEYLFSGAAVARSWGDKVVEWLTVELGVGVGTDTDVDVDGIGSGGTTASVGGWVNEFLNPGYNINPMAFIVSALSTALLLDGVKESKVVTNFFTSLKVVLVLFMTIGGFIYFQSMNMIPLIPKSFGIRGVFRGATSSFFGYIGYDEVCCLAGEAINPQVNMPKAVMLTITFVTILYMAAAVALVGMQDYNDISETSGFPMAFRSNGAFWAAQISAAGEVFTLPIVVLITLMAQPRLQYALSMDGLLPPIFSKVDSTGNLRHGTFYAGVVMTLTATFVPFTYLDDLISAGILVAFCMTDSSVILLRLESPLENYNLLPKLLISFNIISFVSCLIAKEATTMTTHSEEEGEVLENVNENDNNNDAESFLWLWKSFCSTISRLGYFTLIILCITMYLRCPKSNFFGNDIGSSNNNNKTTTSSSSSYFRTPLVPFIPCIAIFINWYLVAQLEASGIGLLILYLALSTCVYFVYGAKHSVGNTRGWQHCTTTATSHENMSRERGGRNYENIPQVDYALVHPPGAAAAADVVATNVPIGGGVTTTVMGKEQILKSSLEEEEEDDKEGTSTMVRTISLPSVRTDGGRAIT